MDSSKLINNEKENKTSNQNRTKDKFENLKGNFFLIKIFENLSRRKSLEILKYNKNLQQRIKLTIRDYQNYIELYSKIEIEIIPTKNKYGNFINFKSEDESYFHIYFNNDKEETKQKEIRNEDKITKIKVIIDNQVKSFYDLFNYCDCIESINFKKFYRTNITDMNSMFYGCFSLKELNLSNFNTENVKDMAYMFNRCKLLKEINLSKFNTKNVIYMQGMFNYCEKLKEINLSNFNTSNVINMDTMFCAC